MVKAVGVDGRALSVCDLARPASNPGQEILRPRKLPKSKYQVPKYGEP